MKASDLIQRKKQLQESKTTIVKQISDMTQDLEWKDLQKFISTGDPGQVDGHKLGKLQRQHTHLGKLEGLLNVEIARSRKQEREHSYQTLARKAETLERKRRGSLFGRIKHFQDKINALRLESRQMQADVLELTNEANTFKREVIGDRNFRLPGLEQFLEQNYVQNPEELEKLVEECYRENSRRLERGMQLAVVGELKTFTIGNCKIPIGRNDLIRGFGLSLHRDTGEIVSIRAVTCEINQTNDKPILMKEVKK